MQITIHNSRFVSTVVKTLFGCGFFLCVSMPARAQTYYYYPASVPATPTVTTGTTMAPIGFWRGNRANQVVLVHVFAAVLSAELYHADASDLLYSSVHSGHEPGRGGSRQRLLRNPRSLR